MDFNKQWNGIREDCDGWEAITYGELLRRWSRDWGEAIAVKQANQAISYEELLRRSLSLAGYFTHKGLNNGDMVIFQIPNSIEFVVALFAMLEIGVVPIMVLPTHGRYEISGICKYVSPKAYFYQSTDQADVSVLAEETRCKYPSITMVIDIGAIDHNAVFGDYAYTKQRYTHPRSNDTAFMLLSGGTTGVPKLIPRTHADYIYNNRKIAQRCELSGSDIYLCLLPASHNFALGNPGILGTLISGGSVVLCENVSPIDIFETIENEKVTFTSMVPSLLSICQDYRAADSENDISSLKFILCGGAMLPESIAEKTDEVFGCALVQIFGTAEGLNCCWSHSDSREQRLSGQGRPISEYDEIIIVNENDEVVPLGQAGEMITRGPYTIQSYYKGVSADSFRSGYYRTGDKAVLNNNYEVRILGRAAEQINVFGEKIMPVEIEEILTQYPDIHAAAIVGTPDEIKGSRVCAFIVSSDSSMSVNALNDRLTETGVAAYKRIDELYLVKSFAMTAVGKIDKNALLRAIE